MANKIYDFLPAHLRNRDLEDIFDATLERVFSKGNLEKTRAFVGRREKGLNNEDDSYLSFPEHLFQRDNYGLEPVFTNDNIGDRVFYEDLLNAMYNKGMLTNDHRRLFESKRKTINLPIDVDKFINWQLYYWVKPQPLYYRETEEGQLRPYRNINGQVYINHPGLNMTSNIKPEYITIDDGADNHWSSVNSWEHHEDIRKLMSNAPGATKIDLADFDEDFVNILDPDLLYYVKNDNTHLFIQAQRPIIEFDHRLEISSDIEDYNWRVPRFKLYDENGEALDDDFTIFEYVQDDLFTPDPVLGIDVKTISGDYASEFVFQITMPDNSLYKLGDEFQELYINCEFNYRNLRREYGRGTFTNLELPQRPVSSNDIDVYVNGIKQIANYSVTEEAVTFDKAVDGDVYVDLCTKDPVDLDGDTVWQRLNPILEYNIDNERHNQKEFTYSVFYEHFLRQLETTVGLEGEANASNNYRTIGNGFEKTRFNRNGSVMVIHDTDVRKGYFSITRDDYDPIKAIEFLASAHSSYKNKLVLKIQELLQEDFENTKTNLEILETAIGEIALLKRENIDVFAKSEMAVFGELYNHYTQGRINTILGSFEHFVPAEMQNKIVYEENVMLVVNDKVMKLGQDFIMSDSGNEIIFIDYMVKPEDNVFIRYYDKLAETFIPPSAVSLGLSELFVPKTFVDDEYTPAVEFIRCHDGSVIPAWEKVLNTETGEYEENRINNIMIMFENLVYNRNTDKSTQKSDLNLGMYLYESEYTFAEKRYTMYPFFKKWMIKNNIDDTRNTQFDIEDWKTWNYRAISDLIPGSYRSVISYIYNTEFIFEQPWLILGLTERPKETLFGWVESTFHFAEGGYFKSVEESGFKSHAFWTQLRARAGTSANWPIPVDQDGNLLPTYELLSVTINDKQILRQDWEFGDGSPEEFAWRRSSEYPFIEFVTKILLKPFKILDAYDDKLRNIIDIYNRREGYSADSIIAQRNSYEFKLGSKLGGFVNNFKLYSERNSFANTSKSEIPSDNYELFIHAGEPNRSESFSAIIIEKVSLDAQYPTLVSLLDTMSYLAGDIVLRKSDGKYYRRKNSELSSTESDKIQEFYNTGDDTLLNYFDYSQWALISQPNVKKFGYRVSGYDDFNPVFYTLDWDKQSGEKRWSSSGDYANIKQWNAGEYYRRDLYTTYNSKPYIALSEHQASESFDEDLRDGKWKLLREWPITNTVDAVGYKEVLQDQLKIHNYGDILETLDEVAQLFVGYQEYLKVVGWDFTDLDDFSEPVDFEHLLKDFLDWSRQANKVGEFITLTPIRRTGRFATPYGVANVGKTTNKNFYRVVDSSGRQLGKDMVKFNIDGDGIAWEATVPVYGIKIDIQDVEHAFVIDREDSYGDMIYDPLSHNRNLRMLIDCNRTADWDGTLSIDGFLASGGQLLPNIETMVEDTRYYRDTLVDQSLEIVNKLKESQLGFAPKMYLSNHFIDRESQLEFHKGFLAGKSTKSSINRLINKKSNFQDTTHEEVWALRLDDYGKTKNRTTSVATVLSSKINSDPFRIRWGVDTEETDGSPQFKTNSNSYFRTAPIKTSGYVNPDDVNYVVRNNQILESTVRDTFYEGDTAWIRFDDDREWDVKRLSEIAEIAYVGETEDGQLYVGLTNEINIDDSVFLKVNSVDIDPVINGYFNLVDDGEKVQNGKTVYEYLVFDTEYEPFVVEIDETTDNSVFVPTPTDTGVEAIGSVSNPIFQNGETLTINGTDYVFDINDLGSTFGITIGGSSATTDPFVSADEDEARIVVYGENNTQLNPNTNIRFDGTKLRFNNTVTSDEGDKFSINGVEVTVDFSSNATIEETSSVDDDTIIASGLQMEFASGPLAETVETRDIEFIGTVNNPTISSTKALTVNGQTITFNVQAPQNTPNTSEGRTLTAPVSEVQLNTSMDNYIPGDITVTGSDNDGVLTNGTDYSYSNGKITFNAPIQDGADSDGNISLNIQLVGQTQTFTMDANTIVSTINASDKITASLVNSKIVLSTPLTKIELGGTILSDLGISLASTSKLADIMNQINQISFMSANIDANDKLVFTTNEDTLTLSGELADVLGYGQQTFNATTSPTATSIAKDINDANITSVSARSVGGLLEIVYNGAEMTVSEVTTGALSRLGLSEQVTSRKIKAIDTIIENINSILPDGTFASNYENTDRIIIISTNATAIELSNYVGNPWDDIGIETGYHPNTNIQNTTVQAFKDQINKADVATDVVVSVSSDGRMIFTSTGTGISFTDTSTSVLQKIGLYENYSSTKSNANFKIMRWKSVRYTPNYIHQTFDAFLTDLGLNSRSTIWADDWNDTGWAVLDFDTTNSIPTPIARQCHDIVDVEDIKRMVVRDGETFYTYQLFDPLNLKLPGSITKDIDYVDWQDPAKYDDEYSNDLWLSEHVGDIWWDTDSTRYYRYKDYGDSTGKINVDYVKRYWGKIVPGSKVEIKQWKSASAVPEDIQWFNTETRWDTDSNRSVTTYYFWSTVGIDVEDKEYSIDEIRMLIESGGTTNKFLPVDDRTLITSNSTNLNSTEIEYTVYKQNVQDLETKHVDWQLLSRNSTAPVDINYLNELRDSLSGGLVKPLTFPTTVDENGNMIYWETIEEAEEEAKNNNSIVYYKKAIVAEDNQSDFTYEDFGDNVQNLVISVNNEFVDPINVIPNNNTIIIEGMTIYAGDEIRVYNVTEKAGWFKNLFEARSNFASIVNDYMKRKMLTREIPLYHEHIGFGTGIFVKENWAISSDFDTVKRYEYLSKTRDFDMIKMFNRGTSSFKVDLPDEAEFYFEYLGNLRLVHKENAALRVQYPDYTGIQNQSDLAVYYDNVTVVQTYELIEMLYLYADTRFVKNMFFDMIDYMYTEKTYPDWIFKTSYIDLFMLNKPLRQYAIYQNDNYNDIIDYVNETKPYHTKIRETERVYPYSETFQADVDIYEAMEITLFFGGYSRYKDTVYDGGDHTSLIPEMTIFGERLERYFESIDSNSGYTALDDYTLDTLMSEGLKRLYNIYTYNKDLIYKVRTDSFLELTQKQQDIINEWNALQQQYLLDPDNEYDTGGLLRRFNSLTLESGGYDTGEFDAHMKDAMIVKVISDTNVHFFVYDIFGRGYYIPVEEISIIDDFDGKQLTTNCNLKHAKDETTPLVALENSSGEVEFIMYNEKNDTKYVVSSRALFNGIASSFVQGDYVYKLGSAQRIVDGKVDMNVTDNNIDENYINLVSEIKTNNQEIT